MADFVYSVRVEGGAAVSLAPWTSMTRILPEVSAALRGSRGQAVAFDERDPATADRSYANFSFSFEAQTARGEDAGVFEDRSEILSLFGQQGSRLYLVRTAPFQGTVEIPFAVLSTPTTTSPRQRLAFILQTLEPFWRGTEVTGVNPVSGITPAGDAPVRDPIITLSAGTNQVLTNTLWGETITIDGSTATPIIIDCAARTILQGGSPANDVVAFSHPRWMQLLQGINTFTLGGGGTASMDYYPKWR